MTESLREKMIKSSKNREISAQDGIFDDGDFMHRYSQNRSSEIALQFVRPEGEIEEYLLGRIGSEAFGEYKSGEMDADLAAGISDIIGNYISPNRPYVKHFHRRDGARFVS